MLYLFGKFVAANRRAIEELKEVLTLNMCHLMVFVSDCKEINVTYVSLKRNAREIRS